MKHMKKMICVLLSLTLILLCAGAASVTAAGEDNGTDVWEIAEFCLGDANVDGIIDIMDATRIQRILAKYDENTFKGERLGDANLSGDIDIVDATYIQRYLAHYSLPTAIGEAIPRRTMSFSNGYARSFVEMNEAAGNSYRNAGSDIIRIIVYVETDYDTDRDGKPDLVKAWVQIPRAAAEGDYKAPVIFEANPYSANKNKIEFPEVDYSVAETELMQTPQKRVPQGVATTEQLAADFRYSDITDYSYGDYTKYDYFLSRGFAIAGSAGIGTRGSEGLELCGTAMEADAFKAIVEWIHGDRKAYSNRTDNLEVKANWSNGKTGMLGVSYMGTLAYEVAATGVDGLEAIVPNAGISSWYDYINGQGAPIYGFYDYCAGLSAGQASRFFDGIDDEYAYQTYLGWRTFVKSSEKGLKGNYGDIWDVRDFSQSDKIKAAALIIQGLSDGNVRPKQFKLMMEAFERSGATAKALLHQSGHASLGDSSWTLKIGSYENYLWLVNRWFSYYLAGCSSNVDRLPNYIVQSNVDGKFYTYDSWNSGESFRFDLTESYGDIEVARNHIHWWGMNITEPTTIKGTVEVHLRAKADNVDFDKTSINVDLVDLSSDHFSSYNGDLGTAYVAKTSLYGEDDDATIPIREFTPQAVTQVFFTRGQVDIGTPNAGWSPQSAVVPDTPVNANEWHDYVIYLEPEVYTVQPGHTLFVGVGPTFDNFSGEYSSTGSIYLDPSACYAIIPTDTASKVPYSR